jgi:hypothetical protein
VIDPATIVLSLLAGVVGAGLWIAVTQEFRR